MSETISVAPHTGNRDKTLIFILLLISIIVCGISLHALSSGYLVSNNSFDTVGGFVLFIFTLIFFAGLAVFIGKSLIDKTPLVQVVVGQDKLQFQSRRLFQKNLNTWKTVQMNNINKIIIKTKKVYVKGTHIPYYFLNFGTTQNDEIELLYFSHQDVERFKSTVQLKMPRIKIEEETEEK